MSKASGRAYRDRPSFRGCPRPSFAWAGFFVTDLVSSFGARFSMCGCSELPASADLGGLQQRIGLYLGLKF